jgi:hypothetical protein
MDQSAASFSPEPERKKPRAGRPPAKHSSPDYAQVTVYISKDVRGAVKMRLFQDGLEFSGLVERLLRNWLAAGADGTGNG